MLRSLRVVLPLFAAAALGVLAGCSSGGGGAAPVVSGGTATVPGGTMAGGAQPAAVAQKPTPTAGRRMLGPGPAVPVCGPAASDEARCHSWRRTDIGAVGPNVAPQRTSVTPSSGSCPNASIAGYQPCDLQSAYKLPSSTNGSGQTVAIVDAYDDPKAESDLGVYRSTFGIPACTTSNGCFKKVNQSGGTSYPRGDRGWAQEISLDLDMASAICPNCHILLVEASSNSFLNLALAVREAAALGANAVSNSYGASESASVVSTYGPYYTNAAHGRAVTASSGDSGYSAGPQFPADLSSLTAVGGTTLVTSSNTRGWSETVWSSTGSGCSADVSQPSWQSALGLPAGCSGRIIGDVAADADPNTGVAVYDSYHATGWLVFGGTSVASPITASVYALAGNTATLTSTSEPYPYKNDSSSTLYDVTSGSNGTCSPAYLCTGEVGYDAPTGLGTPQGAGAF